MKSLKSFLAAAVFAVALGTGISIASPIQWAPILVGIFEPFVIDAFQSVKIPVIATNGGTDEPLLVQLTVQGNAITASFYATDNSIGAVPRSVSTQFDLPGLPPGTYRLSVFNTMIAGETTNRIVTVRGVPASLNVVPMMAASAVYPPPPTPSFLSTKHYLALGDTQQNALLNLNDTRVNLVWSNAESAFRAWPATGDAPASAVPVCRFFNPKVVTHFYSAKASDCALLAASADWTNEGIAFRILLPVAGVCSFGTTPVYRLFSQSLANHRYTRSIDTYQAFQLRGWVGEGVAFCAPQ